MTTKQLSAELTTIYMALATVFAFLGYLSMADGLHWFVTTTMWLVGAVMFSGSARHAADWRHGGSHAD